MAVEVERLAPVAISHVIFGVRYEPQYRLLDCVGSVVDAVLREPETPFGPTVFPHSQSSSSLHQLLNTKTGDFLQINQQDTILRFAVDSRNLERIRQIADSFQQFVLEPLRQIAKLRNIGRIGMLLELADARALLKTPPIEKYLKSDFNHPNTLEMRFSRRIAAEEAFVKKRVHDFRNAIYNIVESEEGNVNISLDYQEYFKPLLDGSELDAKRFDQFVQRGLNYFRGEEFQHWFRSMAKATEAA